MTLQSDSYLTLTFQNSEIEWRSEWRHN